ncbi:MAG: hypothetical protein Fues2KO_24220 [Fuerstiella sp.]
MNMSLEFLAFEEPDDKPRPQRQAWQIHPAHGRATKIQSEAKDYIHEARKLESEIEDLTYLREALRKDLEIFEQTDAVELAPRRLRSSMHNAFWAREAAETFARVYTRLGEDMQDAVLSNLEARLEKCWQTLKDLKSLFAEVTGVPE